MTTKTLERLAAEQEVAVAEQEAAANPNPGLLTGEIVHAGDADAPPMAVASVTDAGWVYVYDTLTGDRSVINRNMLGAQLKKKRPNGQAVFTTRDPGFRPKKGTLKCWLHADHELRPICDELALPTCRKSNIPSDFQVRMHVRRRHAMEFQAIEERRQRLEREEDRRLQRQMVSALGGNPDAAAPSMPALTVTESVAVTGAPEAAPAVRRIPGGRKRRAT